MAVLDELGRSNFELLQDRARARRWRDDLPSHLLRVRPADASPLIERKQALAELLADKPLVILCVQHVVGEGKWLFEHVLALELEGMVAMRLASVYKSGERPGDWLKIKGQAQCRRSGFRR